MFGRKVAVWGVALGLTLAPVYFTASAAHAQDNDAKGGQASELSNKKVTLNLENADIRYALKLLFNSVGANYTLDPGVQGSVTLALTDVSFRTALESAIKGAGTPLTYRVENNVYSISPKVETVLNPVDTNPEPEPVKAPTTRTVKIQINYADAIDLAQAFGGGVITSRLSQLGQQGGGGGFGGGFGGGGFGGGQGGFGGGFGGNGGGFGGGGFGGGGFGGGGFGGGGIGGGGFGGGGFGGGGIGGGGGFGGGGIGGGRGR
jgi:hypothetical protein